jgi:hypothetical protein
MVSELHDDLLAYDLGAIHRAHSLSLCIRLRVPSNGHRKRSRLQLPIMSHHRQDLVVSRMLESASDYKKVRIQVHGMLDSQAYHPSLIQY